MPKVFIIIVNWNGCADTIECIESLQKISYPDYKVMVIDNGSTDNSMDVIPKKYFQDVAFIETKKNLGFAGGNNIGIKYALENGADFVLLLNNDTIVEPDFLTKLVEIAESEKKIGIAGSLIMFYDQREIVWFAGGKVNWAKTRGSHIGYGIRITDYHRISGSRRSTADGSQQVDYITGCCLLAKREVIEKIGLLSEDYFLYYEDADWCFRAEKAGYGSVLVPASKIYHKQSRSTQEFSYPYIYYHSRNGLLFASRFGSKILTNLLSGWIFLKQIIKNLIGYKIEWIKPVTAGVRDFWRGKYGKLGGYY